MTKPTYEPVRPLASMFDPNPPRSARTKAHNLRILGVSAWVWEAACGLAALACLALWLQGPWL